MRRFFIFSGGLSASLIVLTHASVIRADIVSYIDEHGRTHYVDSIERVPPHFRDQAANRTPPPPINKFDFQLERYGKPKSTPSPERRSESPRAGSDKVEIYVTSWCPYCRALEQFLIKKRVRFKKNDIEASERARKAYEKLGGGGVPITTIGSRVIRGFDEAELLQALGN